MLSILKSQGGHKEGLSRRLSKHPLDAAGAEAHRHQTPPSGPELSRHPVGGAHRSPMYCWWCWLWAAMACSGVLCRLLCEPLSPRLSVFWAGRYLGRGHMYHHEAPAILPRRSKGLSRMQFGVSVCMRACVRVCVYV